MDVDVGDGTDPLGLGVALQLGDPLQALGDGAAEVVQRAAFLPQGLQLLGRRRVVLPK